MDGFRFSDDRLGDGVQKHHGRSKKFVQMRRFIIRRMMKLKVMRCTTEVFPGVGEKQ